MGDPGVFKSATFGGFDKKSVLTYIDSLNEEFHKTQAGYQEKLAEFEKAQESQLAHIRRLEAQVAEEKNRTAAVARQLEDERSLARQAQSLIADLDSKTKFLQKRLDDNDREMQIQLERNRQLQFKAESLDQKSRKYDELSTQIGDALIEAKRDAEKIVAAANGRAKEIVRQAQDYMKQFHAELSTFDSDALRLRKSVEEILFVLNDRIDVMQEVVREVERRFTPDGVLVNFAEETEEPEPGEPEAEPVTV